MARPNKVKLVLHRINYGQPSISYKLVEIQNAITARINRALEFRVGEVLNEEQAQAFVELWRMFDVKVT